MSRDQDSVEPGTSGSLESFAWRHPGRLTLLLMAACIVVAAFTLPGSSQLLNARLYDWGAKVNVNIAAGQWWRLLTSSFLHGGWVHLGLNLYALFLVGSLVENLLGPGRLFAIYIVAALTGALASYAATTGLSIGASGAIFGVMSAALIAGLRDPQERLTPKQWSGLASWAGLNLIIGFNTAGVDNAAHLGGLLGGAVMTFLVVSRVFTVAMIAAGAAALAWSGYQAVRAEKIHPQLLAFERGFSAAGNGELVTAAKEYSQGKSFLPSLLNRSGVRARMADYPGALADADDVLVELGKPKEQLSLSSMELQQFSRDDTLELRTKAQLKRAVILMILNRDLDALTSADGALDTSDEDLYLQVRLIRGRSLAKLDRHAEALGELEQAARSRDPAIQSDAEGAIAMLERKVGLARMKQIRDSATARGRRIYSETELDKRPVLVSCNAGLYNIAAEGGYVELRFILDQEGKVELPSVQVNRVGLGGSGPRAVEYIGSCRYRPAVVGGLAVRTQWQQHLSSEPPVPLRSSR